MGKRDLWEGGSGGGGSQLQKQGHKTFDLQGEGLGRGYLVKPPRRRSETSADSSIAFRAFDA